MSTNFGAAAQDYAQHRQGFPEPMWDRMPALGIRLAGASCVDVGTGTGALARGLAQRGARVVGLEPDVRMLKRARDLDRDSGLHVKYCAGSAESIPLSDASVDVVTAAQCWHWFDPDAAALEFARVARPGGSVLVAHFDWLPVPDSLALATEKLILKYNPSWQLSGGDGFHTSSLAHLRRAGFSKFETQSFEIDARYSPEAWRGRIRSSIGIAALEAAAVKCFDDEHKQLLNSEFPGENLAVLHRVFLLVGNLP